jgi:ElaB/YqjD/DUF883 family membrane-anchored ribosome-binding protein
MNQTQVTDDPLTFTPENIETRVEETRKITGARHNDPIPVRVFVEGINPYIEEVEMGTNNWDAYKTEQSEEDSKDSSKSTGFESVKNFIADQLHSVAKGLGDDRPDNSADSVIQKYRKQAFDWLNHSAEYVRTFDKKQADANIREYVNQSPGRSLLIAGGVGLIVGAILRRR